MNECLILIVEDDANAIDSWRRDITDFNHNQTAEGFKYLPIFSSTRQSALQALSHSQINCAVIDLRIPMTDDDKNPPSNDSGNQVLEQVLIEAGVPTIVYSGHPAEASDLVKNSNIKIMTKKGNGAAEILALLADQEGLMSAMQITRKKIAQESAKLFNDSIWRRWEHSWKSIPDRQILSGMISRQIASHVADRLSLPPANHHPDEFYIIPPLFKDRLDTGDLVTIEEQVFVIVTPRCNMAHQPYPKQLIMVACKPMVEIWQELRNGFNDASEKKQIRARDRLRDLAVQNHSTSTHFIPPCEDKGPWLVDFRDTQGILSENIPSLIDKRFASISTHFIPNLVQRYAAYLGRIGQPDIDWEVLQASICK